MSSSEDNRRDPRSHVTIMDRVVVRDDSKLAGTAMLGVLVLIMLFGGALVYTAGQDDSPPTNAGQIGTTGQTGTIGQVDRAADTPAAR